MTNSGRTRTTILMCPEPPETKRVVTTFDCTVRDGDVARGIHVNAIGSLAINLVEHIKATINNVEGCYNYERSLNQLIGNSKPYYGTFKGIEDYCYYNEREWRILIPCDYDEHTKWYWNLSEEEFAVKKDEINKILHSSEYAYRGFTTDIDNEEDFMQFITHIVVDTEANIPELVEFILNEEQPIFGYPRLSKRLRNFLVSRITSFERIENDY